MKAKVLRKFSDKYTGEIYYKGDVIEVSEERYREIMKVGQLLYKIDQDDALSVSADVVSDSSNDEAETPTSESELSGDGFDSMTVRQLKEYADKAYKLTFGTGTKKAEIIAALRKMERNK